VDANLLVTGASAVAIVSAGVAGLSVDRLRNLRSDRDDMRDSREFYKAERDERDRVIAAKDIQLAGKDIEIQRKGDQVETLRAALRGKAEWATVIAALNEHDRKAEASWDKMLREQAKQARDIAAIRRSVGKQ
jgi:hypothetical protein